MYKTKIGKAKYTPIKKYKVTNHLINLSCSDEDRIGREGIVWNTVEDTPELKGITVKWLSGPDKGEKTFLSNTCKSTMRLR